MTPRRLVIPPGAPRALPPGEQAWRVVKGPVEVYLVGPERRRLIAVVAEGGEIFAAASGLRSLSLLSTEGSALEPVRAADPAAWLAQLSDFAGLAEPPWAAGADMAACYAALDGRFAALDDLRDQLLADALMAAGQDDVRQAGGTAAALADAGEALGVTIDGQAMRSGPGDFVSLPALARITGLRAAQVRLDPRWWRDDLGGPLVLRGEDGAATALHWARGAWRDRRGLGVDPAAFDSLAFRIFPPLADDISRLSGMARSVLRGLRSEVWMIAGAGVGAAVCGLVAPLATGWVFDDVVPSGAGGLLIAAGLALLEIGRAHV